MFKSINKRITSRKVQFDYSCGKMSSFPNSVTGQMCCDSILTLYS